ncbi:MAG: snoK, partial [Flavobacterium sp.]|nr:snoK [Aeromicrobium sp.]
ATTYFADGARVVESPTLISGTWRDFLPGVQPGVLAVSELNPLVGRAHT